MSYALRWYQQESVDATWSSLCNERGNPVIVLPTGAGKSVVIAELCRVAVQQFDGRVLVLAHRKELLEQNAAKIKALLPWGVSCGIHSAGLRRHATEEHVICCGIQSVFRKAHVFGARQLVLIDEVHLVPRDGEGMYRTFLESLREINPTLRMVGLTATPFRTGEGSLVGGDKLFQKLCYDAQIQRLIADGFLCPVTNQPGASSVDTSKLHIRGGEFIAGECEQLFGDAAKVAASAREIVAATRDRHSVIVFCSGVDHAEQVAEAIERASGDRVGVVVGSTPPLVRASTLEDFAAQRIKYLCNVDVLTTGFDAPCIDAIAILRATMSPGLFAQICGRGLRTHSSKKDCLILDFGENIARHGPIDAIDYGKEKKAGDGSGDAPQKTCPACEEQVFAGARECPCGWQFPPRELNHDERADTTSAVLAAPITFNVVATSVSKHQKKNAPDAPPTLRVDYDCQPIGVSGNLTEQISEWVCLAHQGFARDKAIAWWGLHSLANPPSDIDDAVDLIKGGATVMPSTITAIREGKWWRITGRQFTDERPESWRNPSQSDAELDPWEKMGEEVPF